MVKMALNEVDTLNPAAVSFFMILKKYELKKNLLFRVLKLLKKTEKYTGFLKYGGWRMVDGGWRMEDGIKAVFRILNTALIFDF